MTDPPAPRTVPRHAGSRLVDMPPHLVRVIRTLQEELRRLRDRTRPETLVFVPAVPSRGEPAAAAVLTDVLETLLYRSGDTLYGDVAAGTGADAVMEFRWSVPDLGITGDAVSTLSGGTERIVRVMLPLPDAWPGGEAHLVFLQARRVSGTASTTARLVRAWQR